MLGKSGLPHFRLSCQVSDMPAQRVMANGVITTPHKLKQQYLLYYRVYRIKNYDFAAVTYGTTHIQDVIYYLQALF